MFMIVVGIATATAKTLTGRRRFVPFVAGFALPLAILSAVLVGETALGVVFGLLTMLGFGLLGYTVRTGRGE